MKIVLLTLLAAYVAADVSHILPREEHLEYTTLPPPHRPYVFSYTAGRYKDHVDRTHSEISDGSGTVRGSFSYVDPRNQVRTTEYIADRNGFHVAQSHEPQPQQQSAAVQRETEKHYALYNKIATDHQVNPHGSVASVPQDTEAVEYAKHKHYTLYEKIAAEHAKLGAENEAARLAFEATSEIPQVYENEGHEQQYYQQHHQ